MKFKALRAFEENGKVAVKIVELSENELSPGNVLIQNKFSSVNYKDALAGTGGGRKILKRFPINPGIDCAGIVVQSEDPAFKKGQEVILTGCNTGEINDGGYSEVVRANGKDVVAKPDGLTLKEAMTLGTAGFTAALALQRMEQNGQHPGKGPMVVTGASGGVGNFAIQIFAQQGYEVIAVSGKPEYKKILLGLGAKQVLTPEELQLGKGPLESVRFGGAVDNVGGATLTGLMASTEIYGNIASIGMAEGAAIQATVMPLILRGVSLLGISSNNCARSLREKVWQNLAGKWRPKELSSIVSRTIGLEGLPQAFDDILNRRTHGRILVEL